MRTEVTTVPTIVFAIYASGCAGPSTELPRSGDFVDARFEIPLGGPSAGDSVDRRPGVSHKQLVLDSFPEASMFHSAPVVLKPANLFGATAVEWISIRSWKFSPHVLRATVLVSRPPRSILLFVPLDSDADCEDFYGRLTGQRLGLSTKKQLGHGYQRAMEAVREHLLRDRS